nr:ABC transporter ATP-binding protein [Microvirga zambiensis]
MVTFGGIQALSGVSLTVGDNEICGLIGPNGAGKTTFLNAVTRLISYQSGTIRVLGKPIDAAKPREVIGLGIARTFQNVGIYGSMTVAENVMLGAHHRLGGRFAKALINPSGTRVQDANVRTRAMEILNELNMAHLADTQADALPYPLQKRMEIARALASEPKILLLDEPAGGLTHGEVDEFGELVDRVRRNHALSILLIEHHMGLVMGLCDRIHVFHLGQNLAHGRPQEIKSNQAVVSAYLGRTG